MSLEANWIWKAETPWTVPGRRPDLGREVRQRRQVVAEHGRRAREAVARELHAVAGVAGETDDDSLRSSTACSSTTITRLRGFRSDGSAVGSFSPHAETEARSAGPGDLGDRATARGRRAATAGAQRVRGGGHRGDPGGLDAGIDWIDTAEVYGDGVSERWSGRAIAGRRDEVVIATQGGARARRHRLRAGAGPGRVREEPRPPRHRPHRPLPAPLARRDRRAARGHVGSDGRAPGRGPGPAHRRLELRPRQIEPCLAIRHVDSLQPEFSMLERTNARADPLVRRPGHRRRRLRAARRRPAHRRDHRRDAVRGRRLARRRAGRGPVRRPRRRRSRSSTGSGRSRSGSAAARRSSRSRGTSTSRA